MDGKRYRARKIRAGTYPRVMRMTKSKTQNFLRELCSPSVRPFLSRSKIFYSAEFSKIVQSVDEHYVKHHDTTSIARILSIFDGTKYLDLVAEYFRQRHGVSVQRKDGNIVVIYSKPSPLGSRPNPPRDFVSFQRTAKADAAEGRKVPDVQPIVPRHLDVLDHPARLPGSYGSGRRR